MAEGDDRDIIAGLKEDKKGLIKQANELHKQLLMVKGALKYVDMKLETLK